MIHHGVLSDEKFVILGKIKILKCYIFIYIAFIYLQYGYVSI